MCYWKLKSLPLFDSWGGSQLTILLAHYLLGLKKTTEKQKKPPAKLPSGWNPVKIIVN